MNLNKLSDKDLLINTKSLTTQEREILTNILDHLREVERRRLYSDLGYRSLFEYAVKELKYSEGQAGRRIQALRLVKEIPEVEEKIESGELNLSHICQAQSYFRELKNDPDTPSLNKKDKVKVLQQLESKSTREAEKVLISLSPSKSLALPKEKERIISEDHRQVSFVITEELKDKLDEVKSLLGPDGQCLSMAQLLERMAEISLRTLNEKKFGKKRVQEQPCGKRTEETQNKLALNSSHKLKKSKITPAPELGRVKSESRYISRAMKYFIWQRDNKRCCQCGSRHHLNIDHIKPFGLGGKTEVSNLRLLCFSCNKRAAIKVYGIEKVEKSIFKNGDTLIT